MHHRKEPDVSLLYYIDQRVDTLQEEIDRRFSALTQQLANTAVTLEGRLNEMNEFRRASSEQAARSPTREEAQAMAEASVATLRAQIATNMANLDQLGQRFADHIVVSQRYMTRQAWDDWITHQSDLKRQDDLIIADVKVQNRRANVAAGVALAIAIVGWLITYAHIVH